MAFAIFLVLALGFASEAANVHNMKPPIMLASESEAAKVWSKMETSIQEGIESLVKQVLPTIIRSGGSEDIPISPMCMSDLLRVFNGVRNMNIWAFQLLDAIGKPASGLLQGTSGFYGSYYECLNVTFPPRETYGSGRPTVQGLTTGQYCILEFRIPVPPKPKLKTVFDLSAFRNTTFKTEIMEELKKYSLALYLGGSRLAVCIPSTCSKDDLNNALKMASEKLPVPMHASVYTCETTYERYPDQVEMGILSFLLALCIVVVLATAYEYVLLSTAPKKEHSIPQSLLLAFSMRQTMRNVSEIGPNSKDPLESLNGMRMISMTWVILGHTYTSLEPQMLRNIILLDDTRKDFFFQIIANAYFSVQTFILVTSVLVSYKLVTEIDKRGASSFNIPIMYLRRFWRMVMPEMLVIAITIILPLMGSGPTYQDTMEMTSGNCRRTWWKNLLSIHNINLDYYICMAHSWYVAIDMQLYLIAMVYFFIIIRNPKLGKLFLFAVGALSVASTGVVTYIFSYPPTFLTSIADMDLGIDFAKNVYASAYPYAACYAVGLGLGTYLARNPDVKITRKWTAICWLVSVPVALFLIYIAYIWNVIQYPSDFESVVYAAMHRLLWSLCVGWVILACAAGSAGPVRSLLSWNGYRPMVRISYMMYLVHFQVMIYYSATRQGPSDSSNTTMVWHFFSNMGITVILCLILRVLAEGPMVQLDAIVFKLLFSSNKQKQRPEETAKNGNATQNGNGAGENGTTEMKIKL